MPSWTWALLQTPSWRACLYGSSFLKCFLSQTEGSLCWIQLVDRYNMLLGKNETIFMLWYFKEIIFIFNCSPRHANRYRGHILSKTHKFCFFFSKFHMGIQNNTILRICLKGRSMRSRVIYKLITKSKSVSRSGPAWKKIIKQACVWEEALCDNRLQDTH